MGLSHWTVQNCSDVLKRFGRNTQNAIHQYELFCKEGLKVNDMEFLRKIKKANSGLVDMQDSNLWVIGNHEYVKNVLKQQKEMKDWLSNAARQGVSVESIASEVCFKFHIECTDLLNKARNNNKSKARKIIAYISNRRYQIPVKEIARYFGITSSSVSNMLVEGGELTKQLNY